MTVTVQIHARDMNVSNHLREYIEKKVSRLDKFLPSLTEARVDVAEAATARSADDRHVAQLTIHTRGVVLRAEEHHEDIFTAVDAVIEKLERQIERYKGKRWQNRGAPSGPGGGEAAEAVLEEVAVDVEEPAGVIARRKHFPVAPMNEAEALEQMALLGHNNFFVFYNADSNRINVLYRRKDGTFGLIEPEVG
jgi:putative sigma-54 modulation protein